MSRREEPEVWVSHPFETSHSAEDASKRMRHVNKGYVSVQLAPRSLQYHTNLHDSRMGSGWQVVSSITSRGLQTRRLEKFILHQWRRERLLQEKLVNPQKKKHHGIDVSTTGRLDQATEVAEMPSNFRPFT